jgi:uncharacterized membrane protein
LPPPFSTEVYEYLKNNDNFAYIFPPVIRNMFLIFENNNYKFFDFSDIRSVDLDNRYMFDGMHTTDVGAGHIVKKISEKENVYKNPYLEKALLDNKTDFVEIFGL